MIPPGLGLELPPLDTASLPPDVRQGGQRARELYATALAFERTLVLQLTKQLAETAKGLTGDDEEGQDGLGAAADAYRQQLPGVLADALQQGGGLGLAEELYRSLKLQAEA